MLDENRFRTHVYFLQEPALCGIKSLKQGIRSMKNCTTVIFHTAPHVRLTLNDPIFQKLLPFHADVFGSLRQGEHTRQLYGHVLIVQAQHSLHARSIFGMVCVYNRQPQELDCATVSSFQSGLTHMARKLCQDGDPVWLKIFSCRA